MSRHRIAVVLALSAALSGCSSQGPVIPESHLSPLATTAPASEPLPPDGRYSLPARTLAALALERVTGRPSDPARLAPLMR